MPADCFKKVLYLKTGTSVTRTTGKSTQCANNILVVCSQTTWNIIVKGREIGRRMAFQQLSPSYVDHQTKQLYQEIPVHGWHSYKDPRGPIVRHKQHWKQLESLLLQQEYHLKGKDPDSSLKWGEKQSDRACFHKPKTSLSVLPRLNL